MYFCKEVKLYGKHTVTLNMYHHGHLKECISDYGPIYSFWLFSFERYNEILGSYQKSIEVQLMQRFDTELEIRSLSHPDNFSEDCPSPVLSRKSEHFSHKFSRPIDMQFYLDAFTKPIEVLQWPCNTLLPFLSEEEFVQLCQFMSVLLI